MPSKAIYLASINTANIEQKVSESWEVSCGWDCRAINLQQHEAPFGFVPVSSSSLHSPQTKRTKTKTTSILLQYFSDSSWSSSTVWFRKSKNSHVDVAEKMGRAPWFQLGALPIFVIKLFGGFSGQHGNHCCYAPDLLPMSLSADQPSQPRYRMPSIAT